MPKYQLNERQKRILRAASKGLRDGTVKAEWTWQTMPSDTNRFDLELEITNGLPAANELGVHMKDLRRFEQLGLLTPIPGRKTYRVNERLTHNIVRSFR